MNIAIDGYEANVVHRVGIGAYAYEIIKGIHLYKDKNTNVTVYLPHMPLNDLPKENSTWRYKQVLPAKFWTLFGLPMGLISEKEKPDVVFSPTHYIPRFVQFPRVMSIMDLSYLYFPQLFRKKDLLKLRQWTYYSASHAQAICTISEATKRDILKHYPVKEHQVYVTYPGLRMKQMKHIDIRAHYSIRGKYILSVGTIQPRKNYTRLIESFSLLKQTKEHQDLQLVIVGKKGWLYEEILAAPQRYKVEHDVLFLDFVPDEHLPSLYAQAECFALPSLYEGFGLPVLEAMAHECLVVVSNTSSLPEIAGEAGILVDPLDVNAICEGIRHGLAIKGTQQGQLLIQQGLKQSKKFNWDVAAQQTLQILKKVAEGAI